MLAQKHEHVLTLESAPSGHLRNCSLIYFHFHVSAGTLGLCGLRPDMPTVLASVRSCVLPTGWTLLVISWLPWTLTQSVMVSWGWIIVILILWHFLQCIISSKLSCTTLMLNLTSCSTLRKLMSRHRLNKPLRRVSMLISHSNHVRMYESSSLREPADACTAHTQLIPTLQSPHIFHQCDNFVFCCVMSCTHGRNLCCLITPNSSCITPV